MSAASDTQLSAVADILRIIAKFEYKDAIDVTAIVAGITWDSDRWEDVKRICG